MSHWNSQNYYSRPGKRQFDEIHSQIEYLQQELYRNDNVLRYELETNYFGESDRAYLAAEMYRNRLIALTESAKSQILLVQMAAAAQNYYAEDNYEWNAKRTKYNHGGDNYYNSPNQHSPQNFWNNNNYGWNNRNNWNNNRNNYNHNRTNKRKAQKKQSNNNITIKNEPAKPATTGPIKNAAPVPTAKRPALLKTPSIPRTVAAIKPSTIPVSTTVKVNSSPAVTTANIKVSSSPVVKTFTAKTAVKRNASGAKIMMPANTMGALIMMPVKPEPCTPKKIPSLFAKSYRLQFSAGDKITVKYEVPSPKLNSNITVKAEQNSENSMEDDLENHL